MSDDPTLDVARDLRAIVELAALLSDQAEHRASHHDLPGGDATVMLGPVASPEAWGNVVDSIENMRWAYRKADYRDEIGDNDDNWEPPLQTLLFWSEAWRLKHNATTDTRPTVESEAKWLGRVVAWAYDNEPHFDDFAKDIHAARARLEASLQAGDRTEHGAVSCKLCGGELDRPVLEDDDGNTVRRDCRCPERPTMPHASHWQRDRCCLACHAEQQHEAVHRRHDQGGLRDQWVCRRCRHTYNANEYHEAVMKDARDNAVYLTAEKLVERFDKLTIGTVRVWANRGFVRKRGRDEYGRMLYDVSDVATRLKERSLAG